VSMISMINPFFYKKINADIYHSQSPNLMSTAALLGAKNKKHVITCRDPRKLYDWFVEIRDATLKRAIRNVFLMFFEEGPLVKWTIKRADMVCYAATYLQEKIITMYGLSKPLYHLPNIIETIPKNMPSKAKKPLVCFIGRLDKRKRPELVLEVAKNFPNVTFAIIGKAEDKERQERLVNEMKQIPNIIYYNYVDKFKEQKKFYSIINPAWIMINTASREAYPLSFFEAGSRGCAFLSHVNPDNAAEKYGYWAEKEDFAQGLSHLLEKNMWRKKGRAAHAHYLKEFQRTNAVEKHVMLYKQLLQ